MLDSSKWNDIARFLKKLRIRKIYHFACLVFSWYWSKWSGRLYHLGLPITLSIEPTTACNLRCPECPSGLRSFTRPTGNLELKFFQNLMDEVAPHLMYLIFYFQGEPFIHPEFLKMVQIAHRKNIYTITSTNGHFLTPENAIKTVQSGLDRIIISIDGTDQSTYEKYRVSGQLSQVISGIENIMEAKRSLRSNSPFVLLQFLVVRHNQHQIEEIKTLAKSLKVDQLRFKTAQIYDYENGNPLIPTIEKYSRYTQSPSGKYVLKRKYNNPKQCWKMWHSAVITWDGKMLPCCFDKDAEHEMGTIDPEHPLSEIWRSPSYHAFRKQLSDDRSNINICQNCSEGVSVWRK